MKNQNNSKVDSNESKSKKKTILRKEKQVTVVKEEENYRKILNKILVVLYILAVLFLVNLVFNIFNMSNTTKLRNYLLGDTINSNQYEEEASDYDVSKFKAVTYDQLSEDIKSSEYTVVYIGRASCGYCVKFIPVMVQGQEEYGFTTEYFDITQVIDFSSGSILDQTAYDGFVEK